MATQDINEMLYEAVERELARTAYPDDLPPLPDLPAARYVDPDFFQLEMKHVFHKSWLCAGHISEIPQPGSFKLFEQLGQSIIISRGTDDVVRAFKNACRHRGAAIVTEEQGVAKRFICPYHSWGYALDGELKSVPEAHNFSCLDKAKKPLLKVRCETWRGFVFINLDENADPFAPFIAPYAEQVADFPFERMVVKDVLRHEIDCNWKTAYDNFLEIYHVATVHRETIAPFLNSKSFVVTPLPNGHARFTTRKKIASLFSDSGDSAEGFDDRYKNLTVAMPRFPNGFTALDPSGFNWMAFWPVAPGKMMIVSTIMGATLDDPEADKAYWTEFSAYQRKILSEDLGLFSTVQRSFEQGDLPSLVLSCQEQYLQWYNEHIDRLIGSENVPAHLRVEPVMSKWLGI